MLPVLTTLFSPERRDTSGSRRLVPNRQLSPREARSWGCSEHQACCRVGSCRGRRFAPRGLREPRPLRCLLCQREALGCRSGRAGVEDLSGGAGDRRGTQSFRAVLGSLVQKAAPEAPGRARVQAAVGREPGPKSLPSPSVTCVFDLRGPLSRPDRSVLLPRHVLCDPWCPQTPGPPSLRSEHRLRLRNARRAPQPGACVLALEAAGNWVPPCVSVSRSRRPPLLLSPCRPRGGWGQPALPSEGIVLTAEPGP